MNNALIAAIDAGTTGTRCCIVDKNGTITANGYCPVPSIYPKTGYVEQDPKTIIELTFKAVRKAVASEDIDPARIIGLCITFQRNSFVPIDAKGNYLSNMITWQDQRGEEAHPWIEECLKKYGYSFPDFYRKNGQPFGSFQCGFKALWYRRFQGDLYNKTYKLITPLAFLAEAFGAEDYVDENNNRSFWLVADADRQEIDETLCKVFDFRSDLFLDAVSPGTKIGNVSKEAAEITGLLQGTPIYAGSGDQQCGALGAGNYGTTDIMSVCLGTAGLCIAYSPSTVRHPKALCQVQGHPAGGYMIEAHSSSCMSSYRWAEKVFYPGGNGSSVHALMEEEAKSAPAGSNGVLFLPYLQGAACPHYDDTARGTYLGMSLANGRGEMIRATIEGICFENRMMLETLQESGIPQPKSLRIVGGASNSSFWNQIQADIYGVPVETITATESTALGAAMICAVSSGMYGSYKEAAEHMVQVREGYVPEPGTHEAYSKVYNIWDTCCRDLRNKAFREIYEYQKGK